MEDKMGLAEDLLTQAWHLASVDVGRPKQANLRRALSSAYYALFHLLVAESVDKLVPHGKLMDRVSRAYQHGEMREVCEQISRIPTPKKYTDLIGADASGELRSIAQAFVILQQQRHSADYDVGFRVSRSEVVGILDIATKAFHDLKAISKTPEAIIFLAALAFAKRWDRNG